MTAPPSIWPSQLIGLMARPTSCAAQSPSSRTIPVSRVHLDLGDVGSESVGGGDVADVVLVLALRGRVVEGRRHDDGAALAQEPPAHRLVVAECQFRVVERRDDTIANRQGIGGSVKYLRRAGEQFVAGLGSGHAGRVAGHERGAAGVDTHVPRLHVGGVVADAHCLEWGRPGSPPRSSPARSPSPCPSSDDPEMSATRPESSILIMAPQPSEP